MQRVLLAALAATTIGLTATSAQAVVTVAVDGVPGTPLPYQIFGIMSTGNPVFGSSPNNTNIANVTYTGNVATTMGVTNGFAQVNDSAPKNPTFNTLIINPTQYSFDQMKFAVQLTTAGSFDVYYLMAGSGLNANLFSSYTQLGNTFSQAASTNVNYLISGGIFDGIMIRNNTTGSYLFEVKQNSYGAAPGAVPEPGAWALMLLGFGGIGLAMRRSRRTSGKLMQIA